MYVYICAHCYRRQTEYYFQGRYLMYGTLIQNAIRKQY